MQNTNGSPGLPAHTHPEAAALFRRPFAPGAIGFRAMNKAPHNGDPFGGAQVAAYIGAQSVLQRLNAVVPGRGRQDFRLLDPPPGARRLYMVCRLIVTLPISPDGPDVEALYEDVGEMDAGSRAGLKALYSDARKRAGVAAGIGAYLYISLAPVALPIGPKDRHVQLIRRSGKPDTLTLSPATEQWLRHGYEQRMGTEAVRRDLGEMLAHGEPERGMGQGEAAEQPDAQAFWNGEASPAPSDRPPEAGPDRGADPAVDTSAQGNGVVVVDFRDLGPDAACPRRSSQRPARSDPRRPQHRPRPTPPPEREPMIVGSVTSRRDPCIAGGHPSRSKCTGREPARGVTVCSKQGRRSRGRTCGALSSSGVFRCCWSSC